MGMFYNHDKYQPEKIIRDMTMDEYIDSAKAFLEIIYTPEELESYMLSEGGVAPNYTPSEEFGKLLPKLFDGSFTPEQFCLELTKKAQEMVQ